MSETRRRLLNLEVQNLTEWKEMRNTPVRPELRLVHQ